MGNVLFIIGKLKTLKESVRLINRHGTNIRNILVVNQNVHCLTFQALSVASLAYVVSPVFTQEYTDVHLVFPLFQPFEEFIYSTEIFRMAGTTKIQDAHPCI